MRPPVEPESSNGTGRWRSGQSSHRVRPVRPTHQRSDTLFQYVFASPFGWMGLLGGERGLIAVNLGEATEPEAWAALEATTAELGDALADATVQPAQSARSLPAAMAEALATLQAYFRNGQVDLSTIRVDIRSGTPLQQRIWAATRTITAGETVSYKGLAERVGLPRGARPTGQAMARNRLLLVVPCHRVVSSSGALTGYSNPQGLGLKQRLLDHEQAPAVSRR